MYKRLAAAALAGAASAAVASSAPPYPSISVCTETNTLIYRSTTEYSTYYVTHTLDESGYPAPTGSMPGYGTGSSSSAPASTGDYGESSSSVAGPTGSYAPDTTVTDITTIYTTTCPAESTYTSGSETLTSTYTTVSTLTSTYQSTVTTPGGYGSSSPAVPTPYRESSSSPASPETTAKPPPASAPYTSAASSRTSTASSQAGGIGSYIISPGPYSSQASPATTSLPPVVPYPVPSGNATYPTLATGSGTPASSGYPVQQTVNAGMIKKPLRAFVGLAGLAAALL